MNGSATIAGATLSEQQRRDLMDSLRGEIRVPSVSLMYRAGILLVTVTMLLLPAIYVGLIGLVGLGWFWYATHAYTIFSYIRPGRAMLLALVVYLGPLVAGALLVLFMLKPLFARRAFPSVNITLHRQQEPVLFEFVDRIARLVGAPVPREICIDCQPNASASFRRGMLSFFGDDLTLTIGMPLVANLTLQQFAGVLAHEFGHFAQGSGMRLSYVVRRINGWFAQVVHERDAWDAWLVEIGQGETHWTIALVVLLSQLLIGITRGILWLLTMVGAVVSAFMMRQMEHDADRYEVQVASSKAFAQTSSVLPILGVASQAAMSGLRRSWAERRLCDDMCGLIDACRQQMPSNLREAIEKHSKEQRTGLLDSHPSDRDRVARASKAASKGFVSDTRSATLLFGSFAAASKLVTLSFYHLALGERFDPACLVPTGNFVGENQREEQRSDSSQQFFQGLLHPLRPLFPNLDRPIRMTQDAAAEQLLALRGTMMERLSAARSAVKIFDEADQRLRDLETVRALPQTGRLRPDLTRLGLKGGDAKELNEATRIPAQDRSTALAALSAALAPAISRIEIAYHLRQINADAPSETYGTKGDGSDLPAVIAALASLRAAWPAMSRLHQQFSILAAVVSLARSDAGSAKSLAEVRAGGEKVFEHLVAVHRLLSATPYPYEVSSGDQPKSIADAALHRLPAPDRSADVSEAAANLLPCLYRLYVRLMSDLALMAQEVESGLGLEPLPQEHEAASLAGEAEPN
jgi:Zn-dependent protease with chaperone function